MPVNDIYTLKKRRGEQKRNNLITDKCKLVRNNYLYNSLILKRIDLVSKKKDQGSLKKAKLNMTKIRRGYRDIPAYYRKSRSLIRKQAKKDIKFYTRHNRITDFNMPSIVKQHRTWWDCGRVKPKAYRSVPLHFNI